MNKVFLTKNISDLVTVRNSFQYQMYNKLLNFKSPLELYPVSKMISFFGRNGFVLALDSKFPGRKDSVCQLTYRGQFRVKFIYSYVCLISQKYSSSTSSSPFCTNSSLVKEILILSLHTSNAIKCIHIRQLFSSELHGFSWSQTVFVEKLGYFTLKLWVTSKWWRRWIIWLVQT